MTWRSGRDVIPLDGLLHGFAGVISAVLQTLDLRDVRERPLSDLPDDPVIYSRPRSNTAYQSITGNSERVLLFIPQTLPSHVSADSRFNGTHASGVSHKSVNRSAELRRGLHDNGARVTSDLQPGVALSTDRYELLFIAINMTNITFKPSI